MEADEAEDARRLGAILPAHQGFVGGVRGQRHRAEERAYIAGLVRKHAGFRQQSTPLPVFDAGLVRSSRMEAG